MCFQITAYPASHKRQPAVQGELLGSLQLPLVLHSAVWEQRAHPHPVLHCIMESGMHNKSRAVALFEASGLDLHTLCSERGKKQTCRTLCSSHSPVLQVQAPRTAKSLKPGSSRHRCYFFVSTSELWIVPLKPAAFFLLIAHNVTSPISH